MSATRMPSCVVGAGRDAGRVLVLLRAPSRALSLPKIVLVEPGGPRARAQPDAVDV
jgi:hypothetical protein